MTSAVAMNGGAPSRSATWAAVLDTWPLLTGMLMLMLGSGLQGTLLGLRAALEGFSTPTTGLVMSCYYIGYVLGALGTPRLVRGVGHIRVFAAFSAIASVTILLQSVLIEPATWAALRLLSGVCLAGIFVIAESWLNSHASNRNRGGLLSTYMLVLYIGLGGGQFLLNVADPAGTRLFMLISVLISLAVVPLSLSQRRSPSYDAPSPVRYAVLFRGSPLGVAAVMVSGIVTGALFSIGPVYAHLIGLDAADTATFMGVSVLTAVFTQLPIGRWSDRVDRRKVLVAVCVTGTTVALLAGAVGIDTRWLLFALAACFGGMVLTIYSLAVAHINDQLAPEQMVGASGAVVLLSGIGASVGPTLVAWSMHVFGAAAYFFVLAVLVGALALYGVYRQRHHAPVPAAQKTAYVGAQPQAVAGRMLADIALESAPSPHDIPPPTED